MTKDDILMMARNPYGIYAFTAEDLSKFVDLVVQNERLAQGKPTKIFGPNLENVLNAAGFYKKREWIGLTDEEIGTLTVADGLHDIEVPILADLIRTVEAKLKEKNCA